MLQPSLLELLEPVQGDRRRRRLDDESEAILAGYVATYARERSAAAVRGEVSQLRSVVRESAALGGPRTLAAVLATIGSIVRVLTVPRHVPSASTASRRWRAIQAALVHVYGPVDGRSRIDALDAALPRGPGAEWYQTRVALAGSTRRRRPRSPTIAPSDLARIVEAAGLAKPEPRSLRDRTLMAVHCFSGLTASEIRLLRWADLRWESEHETWSAIVRRPRWRTRLAIFGPASSLLIRLRLAAVGKAEYVLANARGEPLADRQVRRIVLGACTAAGFPFADRNTLLSAAAAYLSDHEFTDHQIAIALGVTDLRTIDRRLKRHRALRAQRELNAVGAAPT